MLFVRRYLHELARTGGGMRAFAIIANRNALARRYPILAYRINALERRRNCESLVSYSSTRERTSLTVARPRRPRIYESRKSANRKVTVVRPGESRLRLKFTQRQIGIPLECVQRRRKIAGIAQVVFHLPSVFPLLPFLPSLYELCFLGLERFPRDSFDIAFSF